MFSLKIVALNERIAVCGTDRLNLIKIRIRNDNNIMLSVKSLKMRAKPNVHGRRLKYPSSTHAVVESYENKKLG